ncbi:10091_t:CDS:2, partial [Funneliformis geosporum]
MDLQTMFVTSFQNILQFEMFQRRLIRQMRRTVPRPPSSLATSLTSIPASTSTAVSSFIPYSSTAVASSVPSTA